MKVIADKNKVEFLDERYYYDEQTDTYYPSVTTVLNAYPKGYGFYQWLKDLGNTADEVLKRSQERGSRVHSAIEDFLAGNDVTWANDNGEAKYTEQEWQMINRAKEFIEKHQPKIEAIEIPLIDKNIGVGGTIDFVCVIDGTRYIIDWKTGKNKYKYNYIQTAVYRRMWNRQNPEEKATESGILQLRARTRTDKPFQGEGWKFYPNKEYKKELELFKHTKALYDEENPEPKPKNEVYPAKLNINELYE